MGDIVVSDTFMREVAERLGSIEAHLKHLLDTTTQLHSNHSTIDNRVRSLEMAKAKLLGGAAVVGALAGFLADVIVRKLTG